MNNIIVSKFPLLVISNSMVSIKCFKLFKVTNLQLKYRVDLDCNTPVIFIVDTYARQH